METAASALDYQSLTGEISVTPVKARRARHSQEERREHLFEIAFVNDPRSGFG